MKVTTNHWGIDDAYVGFEGKRHHVPAETRAALLRAMRAEKSELPNGQSPLVIREGKTLRIGSPGEVTLEDGGRVSFRNQLPGSLPAGYHWVRFRHTQKRLIVAPLSCHLPHAPMWGWSAQLYAARSGESWGIGDLGDLSTLARWSATLGCGVVLLNPLHASLPLLPQNPSPYYPSSRRFRNPLFLSIDALPGAGRPDIEVFRAQARELNARREIDRDNIYRLKMAALGSLWRDFRGDPDFDHFRREQGDSLRRFAIFNALSELYQKPWRQWPVAHRDPASPALEQFAEERASRIGFHEWLQWLLDRQLAAASHGLALMQDLPIGFDPDGVDAWEWQDCVASGVSVGAPPDEYSADGQDWGLPPFIPHRLTAAGYEPFIQTVRSTLRHSGGLRIDHVMGLFRLFWVPAGEPASRGGYVRYPAGDLLAIVALESQRARAMVVGEDLGTVEPGVREQLAGNGILSYRLVWFEEGAPEQFPRLALAAVSTHDLPTVAGVWRGTDPDAERLQEKLRQLTGARRQTSARKVIFQTYQRLSQAPSLVITASLEDALSVEERTNFPGTVDERPNWSLALPKPLEEFQTDRLALEVARTLAGRQNRQPETAPPQAPSMEQASGLGSP